MVYSIEIVIVLGNKNTSYKSYLFNSNATHKQVHDLWQTLLWIHLILTLCTRLTLPARTTVAGEFCIASVVAHTSIVAWRATTRPIVCRNEGQTERLKSWFSASALLLWYHVKITHVHLWFHPLKRHPSIRSSTIQISVARPVATFTNMD